MQQSNGRVTIQSPVIVGSVDIHERKVERVTKTESNRVSYMGERERANAVRAANVSGTSVWSALCSLAYDTRPLDKLATSADAKQIAKLVSKALRESWATFCKGIDQPTPDASGRSISVIARALALHKMDGIVAELPATEADGPAFYGKTFVEQRDKPEGASEDAPTALARFAKSYKTHAGSRIPPGTGDKEQVEALFLACAMALGRVPSGYDAGVVTPGGTTDHRQAKADSRKQQAKQRKEGEAE